MTKQDLEKATAEKASRGGRFKGSQFGSMAPIPFRFQKLIETKYKDTELTLEEWDEFLESKGIAKIVEGTEIKKPKYVKIPVKIQAVSKQESVKK